MNRRIAYPLLIIIVTIGLFYAEKYVDLSAEAYPSESVDGSIAHLKEFDKRFYPTSTTKQIVHHPYYSLSYSETHEQAEWVAYELSKAHLEHNNFERPYFIQDRSVSSGSADWKNYKNSGYDRGHLCPAADRGFDYDAFHQTFLTSNISPQHHDFNRGVWNRLEQGVRRWARKYDGVFVITGGVLSKDLPSIGYEEVSVPSHFYKIVADFSSKEPRTIAFLLPHTPDTKSYNHQVRIDSIELLTGIDFFAGLSDKVQEKLESRIDTSNW
jgi:endonuclease G, mitochondrial